MIENPEPAMVQPYLYTDLKVPEKDVVRSILQRYVRDPRIKVWRANCGAGQFVYGGGKKSQFMKFGLKGQGDISGLLNNGRRVEIEAKGSTGRQEPDQIAFQQMIEQYGGLYILAKGQTALDDVEAAIRGALG